MVAASRRLGGKADHQLQVGADYGDALVVRRQQTGDGAGAHGFRCGATAGDQTVTGQVGRPLTSAGSSIKVKIPILNVAKNATFRMGHPAATRVKNPTLSRQNAAGQGWGTRHPSYKRWAVTATGTPLVRESKTGECEEPSLQRSCNCSSGTSALILKLTRIPW